ncbi:hypothetical protein SAMN03159293_00433 [Pseudomonas sp. NFACC39-1]|nr:hypothetical protein SAMN03159293_00433 [Pseudomonas sp. NFACC39-1]
MSYPEIIFIKLSNNLSQNPKQASILSKFILNKNPRKRRSTTPDLDSLR